MLCLATWNMNQRVGAWDFLDNHLRPDVALLQEAAPREGSGAIFRAGGIGAGRPWGSAILAAGIELQELSEVSGRHSTTRARLDGTWPGAVVVAAVELDDGPPVTFVSVYGLFDCGYAITTVHRILSDLTPLLDSRYGKRLVLAAT